MPNSHSSASGPSLAAVRPLLKRLGLDEKEIDVYLALLGMKSAKASALASRAGQSRSHTYLLLRSLIERGLVSEIDRGGVLHFVAESPSSLLSLAENRARELTETGKLLEGTLPLLESLSSPLAREPKVTLLHGFDGMKQIYRETFRHPFCSLFNPEPMFKAFGSNVANELSTLGTLHGRDLLVDNAASKKYVSEVKQHDGYEIRLLPKDVSFHTDTFVYGDFVALFAYDEQNSIVRIENRNIADSFRAWFEVMWATGKKTTK
jgi:predicted transcriptional regulator